MHYFWQIQRHIKVKQSLYRPGQTVRFPGPWGSHISRQSGKVCQPYVPAAFTPQKNIPGTHFCYSLNRLRRHIEPEGLNNWKISNDTIGNQTRDLPTRTALFETNASSRQKRIILVSYKVRNVVQKNGPRQHPIYNFQTRDQNNFVSNFCLKEGTVRKNNRNVVKMWLATY
jgi:hypothetical protein